MKPDLFEELRVSSWPRSTGSSLRVSPATTPRPSRERGARPSGLALCNVVAVSVVAESSIQAQRILSRWSRPDDAGSGRAAPAIQRRRELGRAVLRKLLVEVAHVAPLHCRFGVEPEGRPCIRAANSRRPTWISLSHSRGWLAGALSTNAAIGIDLEYHKPDRDFAALASAAFGPQERRLVEGGGATEFYRIWTLREAMAKALGIGLGLVTDGRDHVTPNAVEARNWYFDHSEPVPGFSLAVVFARRKPGRSRQNLLSRVSGHKRGHAPKIMYLISPFSP